jgi:hypothetical protein
MGYCYGPNKKGKFCVKLPLRAGNYLIEKQKKHMSEAEYENCTD